MADHDTGEELKALLSRSRSGGQTFFPRTVRDRVVRYVERQRQHGASVKATARELGLSHHTLAYWRSEVKKPKSEGKIRRVRVVRDRNKRAEPRTLVIRGAAGTTVEGLTVDDVVEILRRLG